MPRRVPPDRREVILSAARDRFAANGYAGTRLEDVAAQAGIYKATLYLHFADKEALFREMIDWLLAEVMASGVPLTQLDRPAADRLSGFVDFALTRLTDPRFAFLPRLIIGESGNFPQIARLYHEQVIARFMAMMTATVEDGIASGGFRAVDARLAAHSLAGGLILGVLWRAIFEPVGAPALDMPTYARAHADIILHGLQQGDGR
jgi:AcrR family transcriptional regulator